MTPIISFKNVSKTYVLRNWKTLLKKPKEIQALKSVSFEINKGEIVGLLGPNGAGKTTILKIIASLVLPNSGEIDIAGHPIKDSLAIRKKVGLVNTNDRSFFWRLSGQENLKFYGHLSNLYGRKLAYEVERVADLVGMSSKKHQPYATYSSGERQRIGIARAMLGNPEILLMDEATSNLDPLASKAIITFTKNSLAHELNKTVIWCTHNLPEAEKICNRVAYLNEGKILDIKPMTPNHDADTSYIYTLLLDSIPSFLLNTEGFTEKPHTSRKCCTIELKEAEIPPLLNQLVTKGCKIYSCEQTKSSLEQEYTSMIQGLNK